MAKRRAVCIMGPTSAGKSAAAMALALEGGFEIVSVDSAMVYRGMDLGTAKPTRAERERVAHHGIDLRDPAEHYSVGDFLHDLPEILEGIWRRGHMPLLVGGTMMYFHAMKQGIAALPARNAGLRAQLDARAQQIGWPEMHRELARIDPAAAARIRPSDPQRIQRALEVHALTGRTWSSLTTATRSQFGGIEWLDFVIAPAAREVLHERIQQRLRTMMAQGFLQEVEQLFRRGDLSLAHASMRAVGYRQLWCHLEGLDTLEVAVERAIVATRQLAKRQLTWLRRASNAQWLSTEPFANAAVIIARLKN